jgi:hypothetical protein
MCLVGLLGLDDLFGKEVYVTIARRERVLTVGVGTLAPARTTGV